MSQPEQPLPRPTAGLLARTLGEWKTLFILGGPILVAQLAQMANGVIDTIMAGHYTALDLAAVGIGCSLWMPLLFFVIGTLSALQPMIAGYDGERMPQRVIPTTWQGLYIAAVSMLLMIALLVNVKPVLNLLKLDADTARIAQAYLDGIAWGVPAMLLMAALRGLTDGLGHTRVIMVFSVIATLFNLPLNYILIYGKLGLPAMGGAGCGWATAISNWLAALLLLVYLHESRFYKDFHLVGQWTPPRWSGIKEILHLGLPIGLTIFVEVSIFAVVALFLAPLGPTVVAGHQIVLNVTSLIFMLPLSLGMALTIRVSFLLGAGSGDSARLVSRSALLLALSIAVVYAPLLLSFREAIGALYTSDAEVQRIVVQLLFYAALFQIADVTQVAAIGSLRGYRDTRLPLFIMLFSFWGISLPLGYTLTFTDALGPPRGAAGFWISLTVGLACAALLLIYRLFVFSGRKSAVAEA